MGGSVERLIDCQEPHRASGTQEGGTCVALSLFLNTRTLYELGADIRPEKQPTPTKKVDNGRRDDRIPHKVFKSIILVEFHFLQQQQQQGFRSRDRYVSPFAIRSPTIPERCRLGTTLCRCPGNPLGRCLRRCHLQPEDRVTVIWMERRARSAV